MPNFSMPFENHFEKLNPVLKAILEAILKELLQKEPFFFVDEFTKIYIEEQNITCDYSIIFSIVEKLEEINYVSKAGKLFGKDTFGLSKTGRNFVGIYFPHLIQDNKSPSENNTIHQSILRCTETLDTLRPEQNNTDMAELIPLPDSRFLSTTPQIVSSTEKNNLPSSVRVEKRARDNTARRPSKKSKTISSTRPSTDISSTTSANSTLSTENDITETYSSAEARNIIPIASKFFEKYSDERKHALEAILKQLLLAEEPLFSRSKFIKAYTKNPNSRCKKGTLYIIINELHENNYTDIKRENGLFYTLNDNGYTLVRRYFSHLIQDNESHSENSAINQPTLHCMETLDTLEPEQNNTVVAEPVFPPDSGTTKADFALNHSMVELRNVMPIAPIFFEKYSDERKHALEAILKELLLHKEPSFSFSKFKKAYLKNQDSRCKTDSINKILIKLYDEKYTHRIKGNPTRSFFYALTNKGKDLVKEYFPHLIQDNENYSENSTINKNTLGGIGTTNTSETEDNNVMTEIRTPPDLVLLSTTQQINTFEETNDLTSLNFVEERSGDDITITSAEKSKPISSSFFTDTSLSSNISNATAANNTLSSEASHADIGEDNPQLVQDNEAYSNNEATNQFTLDYIAAPDTSESEDDAVMAQIIPPPDSFFLSSIQPFNCFSNSSSITAANSTLSTETSHAVIREYGPELVQDNESHLKNTTISHSTLGGIGTTDTSESEDDAVTTEIISSPNLISTGEDFAENYSSVEARNVIPMVPNFFESYSPMRKTALEAILKELLLHKGPTFSRVKFTNTFLKDPNSTCKYGTINEILKEILAKECIYRERGRTPNSYLYALTDKGKTLVREHYPYLIQNNENNSDNREINKYTSLSTEILDTASASSTKAIGSKQDNDLAVEILPTAQPAKENEHPNSRLISTFSPVFKSGKESDKKRMQSNGTEQPEQKRVKTTSNEFFDAAVSTPNYNAKQVTIPKAKSSEKNLAGLNTSRSNNGFDDLLSILMTQKRP